MKFEIQATTLLMLMTVTGCSLIVDGSKYGDSSDSGVADTGVMDTGTMDTGVTDTGTMDTGVTDTGAPPACAEPCMSPKIIDAFGRCVMPHACPPMCVDGSECDSRTGACQPVRTCPTACPSGSSCDGFGQCVPDCACSGTDVHYAGEVGCRAPIDCIPPQRQRMGDPTRCFTPCDACGTSEFCMNGECRSTECSAGPTPFECVGGAGAMPLPIPSPVGASAAGALPAMRITTLPADALTTRVVVVPNPVDASAWGLMWADSNTVKWANVWAHTWAHTPTSGTTCYRRDPGSTLVQCSATGLPLVGFGPADFDAAVVGDLLSDPGVPDIRLGASAGMNTGMWRISTASGNVCGTDQFAGAAPSDELTGRIAVARAHTNPSLYPVHLYSLSAFPGMPAYPAVWRNQTRSVLTPAIWEGAFSLTTTSSASPPSGGFAAAGSIGAYRTQDNRLVIWDGNFSLTPSLAPGFDNLIGDPAAAVDSSTPAVNTATVVAPRSIDTSRELMATTCSPRAGTLAPSCDSGTSVVHIPAPMMDDAPLTAAAVVGGSLYVAVTERDRVGGPALVLHAGGSTGAGAMPLLDRRSVGAPIDQIMAIDLQFIQGAGTLDLVWAAIAEVNRPGSGVSIELWAGAIRFCI